MDKSRRNFLKTFSLGVIGAEAALNLSQHAYAQSEDLADGIEVYKGYVVFNKPTQQNMVALAEALVPGSTKIGIQKHIMGIVSKDHGLASFLDAGLWNIEALARHKYKKPFYELTKTEDKNAIIKHISYRNRSFFKNFKTIVVKFYYTQPDVWKQISYTGPPQPVGYMNYTEPPKAAKKG